MAKFLDVAGLSDLWGLISKEVDAIPTLEIVTGTYTTAGGTKNINLGFRPKLVIVYNQRNNSDETDIATGNAGAYKQHIAIILTEAYTNGVHKITDTGFTTVMTKTMNPYLNYIAFR